MAPAAFRPFGQAADLDLDFAGVDRPALVTALLAQCGADGEDAAFWWAQAVGMRTAALLQLAAVSEGSDLIECSARCAQAACGQVFGFALPVDVLTDAAANAPLRVELDGSRTVRLRRPTGSDLQAWRTLRPASRAEAEAVMLASLIMDGDLRLEDSAGLQEALAAQDPLVAFEAGCACPACGAPNLVAVDLEAEALARLERCQHALLREVHALASHYGWTEAEVLAVPPSRRAHYLAMLEEAR